ncbi:MAG TPA: M48 family metallopeptidase [Verrucomicrobiae bacterium]|nr:M48 family metallopeptidase [Verrucomicrobiae bacterium]
MWEQIRANRRRSAILITAMVIMLALLGCAGGYALAGPDGAVFGIGVALIVWGVQMAAFLTSADSILLHGAYAKELQRDDAPQLFNVVDEMKLASGLPFMPRLYLIDDPAPNAFAIGSKPDNSTIAVTTGLLHRLNRDELQGVIGHEMGHLKNRDVQFMTLAAVMLGSIVILSQIIWRMMSLGGRSRSRSNSRGGGQAQLILLVVALVFAILAPIMAQLLYFACSRKREYLADASSAQFTRYPEGLASALEVISQARVPLSFDCKATAPMFIVNPLAAQGDSVSLFATHPPTSERVRILRSMTGASLADYEAAFRKAKGAACIGSETLRGATPLAVRAPSEQGPIQTREDTRAQAYRAHGYLSVHCNCGLDIQVPEGYERDTIRCIRCGSVLPVPTVAPAPETPAAPGSPLLYTRTRQGWESFRCACGRTIQISPAFAAPFIRCNSCGRQIKIQ